MKKHYEANKRQAEEQDFVSGSASSASASSGDLKASSSSSSNGGSSSGKGDWTSWAFSGMEGLTKSMEKVTSEDICTKVDLSAPKHVERSCDEVVDNLSTAVVTDPHKLSSSQTLNSTIGGWGDDEDLDLDDPLDEQQEQVTSAPDLVVPLSTEKSERRTPIPKKTRKDTKAAVSVKKLTVSPNEKDTWDDF